MAEQEFFVTKPGVTINKPRTAIELSLDLMDPNSFQSIGSGPRLRMTTLDAMRLLGLLQTIQEMYELPVVVSKPEHTDIPPLKDRN